MLTVDSCYAGGENAELAYKDVEQAEQYMTFEFPIVIAGAPDAPSVANITANTLIQQGDDILLATTRLLDLYKELRSGESLQYADIIPLLINKLMNFPYIRFKGRTNFVPLFANITISEIMARTRTKPLQIVDMIKDSGLESVYIVLDTPRVPFPLDFSKIDLLKTFIIFVSGIPGTAAHIINEIIITVDDISAVWPHIKLGAAGKTICILNLQIAKNSYKNVIIDAKTPSTILATTHDSVESPARFIKFKRQSSIVNEDVVVSYGIEDLTPHQLSEYNSHLERLFAVEGLDKAIKDRDEETALKLIQQVPQINQKLYNVLLNTFPRTSDVVKKMHTILLNKFLENEIYDVQLVMQAIKNGANPNQIRETTDIPLLTRAIMDKNVPLVRVLLDHNANVNYVTRDGTTMLDLATSVLRVSTILKDKSAVRDIEKIIKLLQQRIAALEKPRGYIERSLAELANNLALLGQTF